MTELQWQQTCEHKLLFSHNYQRSDEFNVHLVWCGTFVYLFVKL